MSIASKFSFQRRILFRHKTQAQRFFNVSHPCIDHWEKKGANFNPVHREKMIANGINPLFQDGYGEIILPGFSLEDIINQIQEQTGKKFYKSQANN